MSRRSSKVPIQARHPARFTLARNIRDHLNTRFQQYAFVSEQSAALAEKAGIGASTVMRILGARRSASLDTIEALARALGVPVYTLLRAPPARR